MPVRGTGPSPTAPPLFFDMPHHLVDRRFSDQAEIARPRSGPFGLGFELMPGLVQVELLPAEGERETARPESLDPHAQHARVKIASGGNAAHRQNHMVDTVDGEAPALRRGQCNFVTHPNLAADDNMKIEPEIAVAK